jgi:hypothetical protein
VVAELLPVKAIEAGDKVQVAFCGRLLQANWSVPE